ncbi:glycosyl hydrolase [Maribellus mangrovi]|uniref:glycosyl hydrolase n=1 Tax=Maribellus mangrovi TaxID=3133146 RepID=UPI0030ED79D2
MKKFHLLLFVAFAFLTQSCTTSKQKETQADWPEITAQTKPWTRWWWHDSAVTPEGLTQNMEVCQKAGFGGLEITPIYGVKGHESEALKFQSKEWMKALEHTLKEGKRLDLGIDLANASGWPFGGPWIQADNACKNIQYKVYSLEGGQRLNEKIEFIQRPLVRAVGHRVDVSEVEFPVSSNSDLRELALDQVRFEKPLPLQTLMAYSDKNEILDLTNKVEEDGTLNWTAPEGNWKIYAMFQGWHGKMVERAGDGGEGNVIDHFSEEATQTFLKDFDDNVGNIDLSGLRAFFNDSYEVDDASGQANWTPHFFEEFKTRRGYDLRNYLPALFGNDTEETNDRVLCDYRETISDLLLEKFTEVWADWSESHNAVIRNQAHGSPANILDLYAASHIPETEGTNPMRIKMATSAGHVTGKPLIACEAATWLDEHFKANLADAKQNFDRYLSHGVNHIVYHGTPYSPVESEWPGWMFYAAVHFAPTNSLWPDMKALNDYVANCQSFMQNSTPDNDILLYFPIYDAWSERGREMLRHFGASRESLTQEISVFLLSQGYTFDYISDKQIQQLENKGVTVIAPGATYKTILVPACTFIPLKTMEKLVQLSQNGATVIFEDQLPESVPGMFDLEERQQKYRDLLATQTENERIMVGENVEEMLAKVNVYPEALAESGLWFNRVNRENGTCYFISNWTNKTIDQWVNLQSLGKSAGWFNPMNREKGKANMKTETENQSKVYVQLKPGESMILQFYKTEIDLEEYPLLKPTDEKIELEGEWVVNFEKGGPTLPATFTTIALNSWTEKSDELKKFSGTASYSISFDKPENEADAYLLNLGEVHESAAVYLNGEKVATLLGPTYQVVINTGKLKQTNQLEVKVSNLMANRIIDMDRNGVVYKKFYNINFAAHERQNVGPDGLFTAANWEPFKSGLIGPVSLIPVSSDDVD